MIGNIIYNENGIIISNNGDGFVTIKNTTSEKKEFVGRFIESVPSTPAATKGIVENEVVASVLRFRDEKGEAFTAYVENDNGLYMRDFRFLDLAKEWAETKLGKEVEWV